MGYNSSIDKERVRKMSVCIRKLTALLLGALVALGTMVIRANAGEGEAVHNAFAPVCGSMTLSQEAEECLGELSGDGEKEQLWIQVTATGTAVVCTAGILWLVWRRKER